MQSTLSNIDKNPKAHAAQEVDPVLAMRGVGKELWQTESGDRFIERLRREDAPMPVSEGSFAEGQQNLQELVWQRLNAFCGEEFRTQRGLAVSYQIEGDGIWFFRDGERVNRKLSRRQVEVGVSRCPLKSTTEIKDLIDYPYLFAVLMDSRIRGDNW